MLKDSYNRPIQDLRVSITDRCNFKCFYCKSAHRFDYVGREELLSYEEIERLTRIFAGLGIRKVRVTGGEPLLRKNVEELVKRLADINGIEDLALTTNGFNLVDRARILKDAGLHRVTISLDSLRPSRFREVTVNGEFKKVLAGIDQALQVGLRPVKINCVVVRGVNDDEILDFAEFGRGRDLAIRFIEFMPIDEGGRWEREKVVTGGEILELLQSRFSLSSVEPDSPHATSRDYRFLDGRGSIGLIMPVSRPFCGECSRIRLTADGKLRTCLFSLTEHEILPLLRGGGSDNRIRDFIVAAVKRKEAGHRINEPDFVAPSRTMSYIGG